MKIIIDHSNLIVGGGIQVGTSFLYDLLKLNLSNSYYVIQSPNSSTAINKQDFPDNFVFIDMSEAINSSIYKRNKEVKRIENKIVPDVIFTTFGPSYHKSKFPKIVGFAIPYLIYPDSPFFDKISFVEKLKYKFLGLIKKRNFLRNSDALIFETEDARSIFMKSSRKSLRSFTVSNTINEIFLDKSRWLSFQLPVTEKNNFKILCLSANYLHKNLSIIPEVIDFLKQQYNFYNFKFYISLDEESLKFDKKYNENIEYLGKIDLNKIPNLYEKMDMVFIPTLLEVFSATYLEAMFMRKPIVASNMSFAKDICNNAALYCEPLSPQSYAKAIFQVKNERELREELINNGLNNYKRYGSSLDRTLKYLEIITQISTDNETSS
ncbi:glycosyltransferase [Flavobacterium sp. xlx-214]|uniref:glycosyltransferase n=1 Tax=unclassified Flavobacterium TaxID=196869 RepID=UPI0013D3E774|nr:MULTISPECIES: glycosyltransferase [unclassified Flavobacterium]MBA5794009.1 glycosyltransferase [Flavobacterium sp. xlx-221]QMI83174.1 glycosyltransferase [Flavobacterium sp. xlx-214]